MPAEPTGSRPTGRRALIARPVGLFLPIGSRAFLVTFLSQLRQRRCETRHRQKPRARKVARTAVSVAPADNAASTSSARLPFD